MTDSAKGIPVTLGARDYAIVPQRIGRITRKLSAVWTVVGAAGDDSLDQTTVTDRLYEALEVFIPDIAPRWELAGYGSAEDYAYVTERGEREQAARDEFAAGLPRPHEGPLTWADLLDDERAAFTPPEFVDPYEEARDRSPTPMEIADAIEAIYQAHGGQRLVRLLGNVIGPEAIRAVLRNELIRWASERSQGSPSLNGGQETSTISSTEPATPAASSPATPPPAPLATQPMDPSLRASAG